MLSITNRLTGINLLEFSMKVFMLLIAVILSSVFISCSVPNRTLKGFRLQIGVSLLKASTTGQTRAAWLKDVGVGPP